VPRAATFSQLTVDENVRIGSDMRRDRQNIAGDFERVMGYFPFLRGRLSTPGGKLSGGKQQQLVIARALMTRPRIMLIDEPSLGLAIDHRRSRLRNTRALRKEGNTLLVVEQSTHRALENADHLRDAERTDRTARPQQGSYRQGTGTRLFRLRRRGRTEEWSTSKAIVRRGRKRAAALDAFSRPVTLPRQSLGIDHTPPDPPA
jgi:energy-coupling factor transporter ATP-binding protein EcfA2